MNPGNNNSNRNRQDLKEFFRDGEIPSQNHFHSLIDSTINKHDDGFSKNDEDGLVISSSLTDRFISFYKNIDDLDPFFMLEKDDLKPESIILRPNPELNKNNEKNQDINAEKRDLDKESFFFNAAGGLGIGKKSDPKYRLDVKGLMAAEGRIGTFRQGSVPADGQWHSILDNLNNCQAFEVVARTGLKGKGRFAILHAYALSAFGKSKSRIRKTSAHFGPWWNGWNKIRIRWKSNHMNDYELQIKTNSHYRDDVQIFYTIGKLWDDKLFLPKEYYY